MANKFGVDVYDGLAVVGLMAVLNGIARWSHAAAEVVGGVFLLAIAIGAALRKAKR